MNLQENIRKVLREEGQKQSLLSLIEEHGLYEFMKMTGLSMGQVILSPNKIVNSFYLSDGVVTIEVLEVDSRGRVLAGSFERLSVLSDEEIFSLVDEMTQISDDFLSYM